MLKALLAVLLLCVPALAQEVKLPPEIKGDAGTFIEVKATTTDTLVKWRSVDPGLMLFPAHLLKDTKTAVVLAMREGRYRLLAVSAKDGTPSDFAECWVVIGNLPTPVPIPTPIPTPTPVPVPVPPPDPTPAGPRTVLILRESADDSPALARLYTSLQAGQAHQYLKSKGHACFVLDDDARDANGQPVALVEKWKAALNLPVPCVAILDDKANILIKATLAPDATDDVVLNLLKLKEAK